MDPQIMLIGGGVFVFSATLIYIISFFTMREKTFEEVIEEQRRRHEEEERKIKSSKRADKEKRVKHKRKYEKSREHAQQVSEPDLKVNKVPPSHVQVMPEPEIIEPIEASESKARPPKVKKNQKPILVNKNEKSAVTQNQHAEHLTHSTVTPKDEVVLKHDHITNRKMESQDDEAFLKKVGDLAKKEAKQEKLKERPKVHEPVIEAQREKVQEAAPPSENKKREKPRSTGAEGDSVSVSSSRLIANVKTANLSDTDIQSIIDILLNKQQGDGATWSKKLQKGDPVTLLRKQLEEREQVLQEEQQTAMAANNKLREIRLELNREREQLKISETQRKEVMVKSVQEKDAFRERMQQSHDQHLHDMAHLQAKLAQLESQAKLAQMDTGDNGKLKSLTEENKILKDTLAKAKLDSSAAENVVTLKQKVIVMETSLHESVKQMNASENSKKSLEVKVQKYEQKIRQHETENKDTGKILNKKLDDVSQQLRKSDARNSSLVADMKEANESRNLALSECASMKTELKKLQDTLLGTDTSSKDLENRLLDAEQKKVDLEGNLKNLQVQLNASQQKQTELQQTMMGLAQQNQSLVETMQMSTERQQGEGQEAPSSKSGRQNGDVAKETTNKNMIPSEEHEKILSAKNSEIEDSMLELANKKRDIRLLTEEVEGQRSALEAQRKKNNELREKNWKAMDALDKTEKSVKEKVDIALKSATEKSISDLKDQQCETRAVLERMFPNLSFKDSSVYKEWLSNFENQTTLHIKELSASAKPSKDDSDERLKPLEENIRKLESQVQEYRKVLAVTESQLQHLQSSVEDEEQKWKNKLHATEAELHQTKLEAADMKKEFLGSTERDERLEAAEIALVEAELQNADIEKELSQSKARFEVLEKEIQGATESNSELEDLRKVRCILEKEIQGATESNSELEDLRKLVADLREEISTEQKKCKELAVAQVRLNGIIKTGQAAITHEQKLVQQLQEQMETSKKSPGSSELEEIKKKLSEKESRLEKEMLANKQLSQRLAASGSGSSGTSV